MFDRLLRAVVGGDKYTFALDKLSSEGITSISFNDYEQHYSIRSYSDVISAAIKTM
jgi:hypothetical protein